MNKLKVIATQSETATPFDIEACFRRLYEPAFFVFQPPLLSRIDVHFHVGQSGRRFHCRGYVSETAPDHFQAIPLNIREVGGAEILISRLERGQPIGLLPFRTLDEAGGALQEWCTSFVEQFAPRYS